MIMIEIIREENYEKIYIEDMSGEKTLLTLLQENGIVISAPCNGRGECRGCLVRFLTGAPVPTEKEQRLFNEEELIQGFRLACAVHVKETCRILLPESKEEKITVLTQAAECVKDCAKYQLQTREMSQETYGIAIDIGTTTLAAELVDLRAAETSAIASGINHQRAYGADVISRISAANEGKGDALRECIKADVVRLIDELLHITQKKRADIEKIAVVGNTTMCHLLRGISCEGLGRAPFVPTDNSWCKTDAKTLFGMENCRATVTILPGISAFVGADIVAGIYASEIDKKAGANMLVDIGTNGEMVLACEGRIFVTSTAAGPVFEGGNVSCGMPGIPGAICHAILQPDEKSKQQWKCETIGNQPPQGLCGTGVIDVVSELFEAGRVDENGTLHEPWFTEGVAVTDKVTVSQGDIREVQMGKAAIRAGIEILLDEAELRKTEPFTMYLAGGFGYYIDTKKAIHIGMLPEEIDDRIICIGNSALAGAVKYLLSEEEARKRVNCIISSASEVNLAKHPAFEELYLKYMSFE